MSSFNCFKTLWLFSWCITSQIASHLCTSTVLLQDVTFDLSTYDKLNKSSHVFFHNINLAEGNAVVTITNAPANKGFLVVQAHSLYSNISISTTDNLQPNSTVNGTNVGLVLQNSGLSQPFFVKYVEKPVFERVLLAVVVYEKYDPIPGGCNMVLNPEVAPYQLISYTDFLISVDAQLAFSTLHSCEQNPTHITFHHYYLRGRDLNENSYFEGILDMMTVDRIKANSRTIPAAVGESNIRRYFNAYIGIGSVFGVVAHYGNFSSAYVPAVTYACDVNNWDTKCIGPVSVTWKILCAIFLFLGLFTCYYGHRFFKSQMFIFGLVFGGFVSYISASITNNLSIEQSIGISIIFGVIYGATWILFWWRFGSPILSVFLPVSFIGYLTACILFYTGICDFAFFHNDVNFWGALFIISFPITVFLLIATMFANMLACSTLGATATIIALDHYFSGTLHYIIVNNVRRATVPKYNHAILDPPCFNASDITLSVIWVILIVTGVYAQLRQQRGKPPFPPPTTTSMRGNSELTPLLSRTYSNQRIG